MTENLYQHEQDSIFINNRSSKFKRKKKSSPKRKELQEQPREFDNYGNDIEYEDIVNMNSRDAISPKKENSRTFNSNQKRRK